jgi:sulfonate transport system substrate-binding protein
MAVVLTLALGTGTGGAVTHGTMGSGLTGVTLQVGVASPTSTASQDIRLASGAFERTPYTIEWASFPTSTGVLEALNAGALDLAVDIQSTAPLFAQANAGTPWTRKSAPFRLVAAALPPAEGGVGIYVRTDSGIDSVKDLRSRKVAYTKGSSAHYYWVVTAEAKRVRPGTVEEVNLATAEARPALLSGAVDAMVTVRRNLLSDITSGKVRPLADADLEVPEYKVTVARADALDDGPTTRAVGDFLRRLARSKRWLSRNPQAAAAIYVSTARMSPADAAAATSELPVELLRLSDAVVAELQRQDEVFFGAGVTSSNPKVGIIVDRRFHDAVGE